MTAKQFAGGLAGLLAALGVAPRIQAGSPARDVSAFVRDFYAAYGAKDTAALAGFYSADATLDDPTFELALKGREQIRRLLTTALAKYESLDWEISHTVPAGDDVVVEGALIGRIGGRVARVRFVSVFHFQDGRISAQRDMFDVLHFYAQLGVVPPQFRPKPAPDAAPGPRRGR